jgi:beta-lactamase regulating signal transducer with metallopeptidase domain/Tol biopolymer transport system component
MNVFDLLNRPLVESVGWTLVHFVWQGAVIALALGSATTLLRRASDNTRYVACCLALVLMAVAPLVTFCLVLPSSARPRASTPQLVGQPPSGPGYSQASASRSEQTEPAGALSEGLKVGQPGAGALPSPDATASSAIQAGLVRLLPWLVIAWMLGVLGLSARLLVGWTRVCRIRWHGTKPVGDGWQQSLKRLTRLLRVSQPVRLVESVLVEVPTVIGCLRPIILLPASSITGLSVEQLEALIAHELAHIRRHDYFVNLLQAGVETLLFYHPAVWWVSHRIRLEREACCDEVAIGVSGSRVAYARALAAMEEIRGTVPRLAVAASGAGLLARIRRVLRRADSEISRSALGVVCTLVLVALLVSGACVRITALAAPYPDAIASASHGDSTNSGAPPVVGDSLAAESQDDLEERLSGELFVAAFVRTPPEDKIGFKHIAIAVDPNTGKWRTLFDFSQAGNRALHSTRVSPDGETLLFSNNSEVWSCDTRQGLAPGRVSGQGDTRAWSPDSKHFIKSVYQGTENDHRWQHWKVSADGSDQSLVPIPDTDRVCDWSPDGNWLLVNGEADGRLYIMKLDGSERHLVTPGRNHFARFAPDGKRILYTRMEGGGQQFRQTLRVVNADGTEDRELLGERGVTAPAGATWSPDGKYIAVLLFDWGPGKVLYAGDEANYRLAIMEADGSNLLELQLENATTVAVQFDGPEWRMRRDAQRPPRAPQSAAPTSDSRSGRIEGRVLIDDLNITKIRFKPNNARDVLESRPGSDGRFAFAPVPAGPGEIQAYVQLPNRDMSLPLTALVQRVSITADRTARVTFGGAGRPLVGRVVLPQQLLARRDDIRVRIYPPAPPFRVVNHKAVGWEGYEAFLGSKTGRQCDQRRTIDQDGRFRFEGVPAGRMYLQVYASASGEDSAVLLTNQIEVPDQRDGATEAPFDLGEFRPTAAAVEKIQSPPPAGSTGEPPAAPRTGAEKKSDTATQPGLGGTPAPVVQLPGRLFVAAGLRTAENENRFVQLSISIDPNTGSWTRLQSLQADGFTVPISPVRVSHDGRAMLFMRDNEIWKCDAATGENPMRVSEQGLAAAWSPDGTEFIAVVTQESEGWPSAENWKVSDDGQKRSKLALPVGHVVEDWSADGSWVVGWSVADGELFVAKSDGTGRRRLTNTADGRKHSQFARFSPDSRRIVYHCQTYAGDSPVDDSGGNTKMSLRVINIDGTGDSEILGETKAESAADSLLRTAPMSARWSPDAKHLVVVLCDHSGRGIAAIGGNWRLAVIDSNGGNLRELKLEGVLNTVLPWDGPEWRRVPATRQL